MGKTFNNSAGVQILFTRSTIFRKQRETRDSFFIHNRRLVTSFSLKGFLRESFRETSSSPSLVKLRDVASEKGLFQAEGNWANEA